MISFLNWLKYNLSSYLNVNTSFKCFYCIFSLFFNGLNIKVNLKVLAGYSITFFKNVVLQSPRFSCPLETAPPNKKGCILMNDKYTIAEISRFLNISKSALRYYDSIGLCKPSARDTNTGYRYYEYNQLFQLNMIGKLKKLQLSLEQIKAHSSAKNVASLEKLLLERRSIIEAELAELSELNRQNEELIDKIELSKHKSSAFEVRQYPERYLYRMNINFSSEDLYACIKLLYSSYIKALHDRPSYDKGEILLEIHQENLENRHFQTYNSIGFFVKPFPGMETKRLSSIPAGTFIVACHTGGYQTISRTYRKLWNYIEKQGLTVTGNSIETSIINISMTNNPKEFLTEIQIPIGTEKGCL